MRQRLNNVDCMAFMREQSDLHWDLAIVDPPYGIGRDGHYQQTNHRKNYAFKGWDNATPTQEYFDELFRVSKNQIIWGANYFTTYLPPSMGWIVWDKGQRGLTMSDGELAFTSFDRRLEIKNMFRVRVGECGGWIHPTQKPVALYRWLLQNYAKPGDKILDTHAGSFSSAIACHEEGFEYDGCEIDEDYYKAGLKRFQDHVSQMRLF